MQLNRLEFLAMNNPLRRMHMRFVELKKFQKLLQIHNITLHRKIILDAACGSGYSLQLLQKAFNPKWLIGFDIMPEQVRIARRFMGEAGYFLGDITQLPLATTCFDAVFAFGIVHHVENWHQALQELYRVLKPGGYLLIEEPDRSTVKFFGKYLRFAFPAQGQFTWYEFEDAFRQTGFLKTAHTNLYCDCFRSYLLQRPQVD